MAKYIWIVNYYTSPDSSNPRYLKFAKYFMDNGWDVLTFYADYQSASAGALYERLHFDGLDFVKIKVPNYVGNGFKRVWSICVFAWRLFRHIREFDKPDVVLHNIHPPFDYPIVWAAKHLKAKYIAEEWDSWPEDFVASGLVSAKNPFMRFAYYVEKLFYIKADAIISTLQGTQDHIIQMGWAKEYGGKVDLKKFYYINNGVDLEQFDIDKKKFPRLDEDINNPDVYKIVYLGSLNGANQVQTLIEAAFILKDNPKFQFFIYGDGYLRIELENLVKNKRIGNVVFKEHRVPFSEVAWIVSQATVNVMNYEKGFGRWGVSSGKLFMYLAAGKPIVCNVDIKYDNIIKEYELGVCKDIDSAQEFADSIKMLAEQSQYDYSEMCLRVRKCASKFDYKVLSERELNVINSLVDK